MMQAMEFNSAWSQNMTEFERQAREIEETATRRHRDEYGKFQAELHTKEPRSYKFSRELLHLKTSIDSLAISVSWLSYWATSRPVTSTNRVRPSGSGSETATTSPSSLM